MNYPPWVIPADVDRAALLAECRRAVDYYETPPTIKIPWRLCALAYHEKWDALYRCLQFSLPRPRLDLESNMGSVAVDGNQMRNFRIEWLQNLEEKILEENRP